MYISLTHGPYYLQAPLTEQSPRLDLQFVEDLEAYSNKKLVAAVKKSISNHSVYLSEQLVVLALADSNVCDEEKSAAAKKLFSTTRPRHFEPKKPSYPKLEGSQKLHDFISPGSWAILNFLELESNEWLQLEPKSWHYFENYRVFKDFVKNLKSVNDYAERNIRLVQDFIMSSPIEERRQNNMMSAKNHRLKIDKKLLKESTFFLQFEARFIEATRYLLIKRFKIS